MISKYSNERKNVTYVAVFPPVRLWCVISFAVLCCYILTIHVTDLPIFWESSRPRDSMKECATIQDIFYFTFWSSSSEGSLAQIASANAGFYDFSSINEESNRDGG